MNVELQWSGGDPNTLDQVTYVIQMGTSPSSLSNTTIGPFSANETNISWSPSQLEYNTPYWWKIVAEDSQGETSAGPVWTFTTINETIPVTTLQLGSPVYGMWITNHTNISFSVDNDEHLNATYYRLWYDDCWHPLPGTGLGIHDNFSLFQENITLASLPWADDGGYYIEYYSDTTDGSIENVHNTSFRADNTPPTSQVSLSSYLTAENITITAVGEDAGCGVANISLYYRYSQDNASWGAWQQVDTYWTSDVTCTFSFPDGVGYYQFASRSSDHLGNREPMLVSPEVSCRYFSPDVNQDGAINVLDFVCVASHWLEAPRDGTHHLDLNGDGRLDLLDLVLLSSYWAE